MNHYVKVVRSRTYGQFDPDKEYKVVGYTVDCFIVIDNNGDRVYVNLRKIETTAPPSVELTMRQRESLRGPGNPFYMHHDGLD